MRHLNHTTLLTRGLATALAALALEATAQVPAHMPNPDKADEQAKRLAESPFRRILEAGRVEVKLRREVEAPAPAAATSRRVTAAAPPAAKLQAPRAAGEAPAPLLASIPATTAAAVSPPPVTVAGVERLWAAFNGATAVVEGGSIEGTVYSEKPSDAILGDISVGNNGVLNVTGQFNTRGGSQWAGVGIVVISPRPVVASAYKALKVHLAGHTVGKLRLRILGDDTAIQQRGCYPVVMLPVKPQVTEYRVEFSQFAAPEYCGADGVDVKTTLESLTAIEIIDAAEPVRDRAVSFNVGTLSLLK
ncbi:hypothetical protein [Rhizobacter sp. OV335]|uniref:hypothetical protein n=1 Tax=Rhizobacter sp. OV335 TaxID=1500264 RepID=UPI00091BCD34|nr:hypothetical protein [Rhizobacter sp. OV335]SHN13093.1 hypothetical protein SAMN02787076_03478 [Rhizobacter sp. OV335]